MIERRGEPSLAPALSRAGEGRGPPRSGGKGEGDCGRRSSPSPFRRLRRLPPSPDGEGEMGTRPKFGTFGMTTLHRNTARYISMISRRRSNG
ncbi:hypothetical protein CVN68_09500 [Sphingomonas psychrotolerans]|uniref:Uncharacterized protein n=1 Tax=Sphingomonas psychrotolerans TaxID=1327635 RepID=A0A2K8ME63_9SPHN|nr:hypothetical protein CVN68_09500 [Sphingomonas psychrotolerans]